MSVQDLTVTPEAYAAATEGCALVDRSERGKLALTGPDAKAFLNGQVTNEIEKLSPGEGAYAAFLTHKGKMLGDLRVLRTGDEWLLDTERVALQALFDMIRRFKVGFDAELHKRTLQRGLLSLVGPRARAVAGAEEAAVVRSALQAGVPQVVVVDELQREVERRLMRLYPHAE